MSFVSIGIKTSIPVTTPTATSGAVTFTSIDDENWLQISGDASAGSGSLYLLRWYPDLAEWRVYMEDKPMSVNSATFSGQFSGHYPFPSREESFVLYDPAAAITATASCARTSSPLTALSVTMASTLPTGAATASKQDTGNASLATIATQQTDGTQKTQVTNTVAVSGPLTDAQLRASAVPISAASLPLPTGAATASLQGAGLPAALVGGKLDINLGTSSITLPVSGPLTDAQLRAAAVPVSASALPLPTGAATEATLALIPVAQASTTSGQSGLLMQGAVTTAAPSYTTAKTSPLSLTLAGALRTDSSATTQPISASSNLPVSQATAANLNATTTQGPGSGSVATFWYTRNTDGTNTMPTMDAAARSGYQRVTDGTNTAAVKAASTAAAASDPSMVVAVSPNSPATVAQASPANLKATTFPGGSSSYNTNGANETRTVRTGAGVLRGLIINPGGSSTFVVYDNTAGSGTVLVALTTGGVAGGNGYFIDCFDVAFSTGLTYVSTGGCNVTLVYYF